MQLILELPLRLICYDTMDPSSNSSHSDFPPDSHVPVNDALTCIETKTYTSASSTPGTSDHSTLVTPVDTTIPNVYMAIEEV